MGIPGEKHMALAVGTDLGGNFSIQLFSAGEAKRPIHKVVLIVNDEQIAVHFHDLLCFSDFKIPNEQGKVNEPLQDGRYFGRIRKRKMDGW